MNKNYYEFVFMNDLGRNLSVKIPMQKLTMILTNLLKIWILLLLLI